MLGQGMLLLGTPLALLGSFHAHRQGTDEPPESFEDGGIEDGDEEPPPFER